MRNIRDFDPKDGMAFQGDVSIVPVPHGWRPSEIDEIQPIDGRLILQEGEITGHHHAIYAMRHIPRFHDTALSTALSTSPEAKAKAGTARLFRDPALAQRMASSAGPLTRSDLIVGFLVVESAPVVVTHEEHDGIRLIEVVYCIGNQVESAGAEERRVVD